MKQPFLKLRTSLQKSLKRMTRRQEMRRLAARQEETLRDGQRLREGLDKKSRRRLAGKEAVARREAVRQSLHAALRLQMLQRPAVRRWATRLLGVVTVVSLIGNVLQYFRYSPWRPLVTVGHRVIRQREFLADLDGAAGKTILNKIVYSELIQQAADKAGVMPTAADVDARVADLKRRSPQGLPPNDALWGQVRLQMALENLRMRGITAGDSEVAAFYAQHRGQFAVPARTETSLVVTRSAADAARAARLLTAGKTEDEIAAQPGMHVAGVGGFRVNVNALPPAASRAVGQVAMTLPIGAVQTLRIAPDAYFTFKPRNHQDGVRPALAQVRDEVARLVRLQKAPSEQAELAALYHAAPPNFDMARYARYFSDLPPADPAAPKAAPKTASLPPADAP